jgi:hypothetical protein
MVNRKGGRYALTVQNRPLSKNQREELALRKLRCEKVSPGKRWQACDAGHTLACLKRGFPKREKVLNKK